MSVLQLKIPVPGAALWPHPVLQLRQGEHIETALIFSSDTLYAVGLTLLLACSSGSVDDTTGPITPPVDTSGNGTAQRAMLTVRLGIDPLDASIASTAGVGIANLTVRLERQGSADPGKTGTTNSAAHFEIIGTDADVDNPQAGNMHRLKGTAIANSGRGEHLISGTLFALASAVASDTLDLQRSIVTHNGNNMSVFRVPRHAILDAVGSGVPVHIEQGLGSWNAGLRSCEPWAHQNFERDRARLIHAGESRSMRRKSLGRTADGREILQRTGTASRDFELALPLRRSLDK